MYCYQKVSTSIFITSETERNWGQTVNHGFVQEESVSKQTEVLCSSLLWIRWIIKMAWMKPHTTCQKQESRNTKILGNTFKTQHFGAIWSSLNEEDCNFYQTRSNAVILCDTLPAEFIEKSICMKTKDQLYQKESVILRPRVVLRANSQSGSQDLPVQEARSSWESRQDAESYGETRSNTADYRVPGFSISTVKLQDARRQNNVTKFIEMFEKHRHEEQFLKDMSQKQETNRFSEEPQQLLVDMNHAMTFGILLVLATLNVSSDGSHVSLVWFSHSSASPWKHHLSFRCTVFWSSTGILLNDKARDRNKIASSLLDGCRTPLVLQML